MDIQWTDEDPDTGDKRFVSAERFAREWKFFIRYRRRENWQPIQPTKLMWEELLDGMERRLSRREGIEEFEIKDVKKILANWKEAPSVK